MKPLLEVRSVSKRFGGLNALNDVSFSVNRGEIYGIIGPNGAGKTTLFNALTGLYVADAGAIHLAGQALHGSKPHQISRAGFARTFQNIRLFANMTALENVMVGRHGLMQAGVLGAILRTASVRQEEADTRARALALLKRVGIHRHSHVLAKNLAYGDQRRLEIARALASNPVLLALDEPAAGMNPTEKNSLRELMMSLRDNENITLMLIEHDVKLVMRACDRVLVLDHGEKLTEGSPAEVRSDPRVISAYLGQAA